MSDSLTDRSALELSAMVASGEVSCVEVVAAHLDRVAALEPLLHALVSRVPEDEVFEEASRRDAALLAGAPSGWLHGLPHAVKDLADLRGLPTSLGLFDPASTPPAREDESFVGRIRRAGAVFIGKTNTSELGVGSHTYNQIAPTTANVVSPAVSAGGSSGGAAVAVAAGYVPVADGSDFMGSLRNPPGWNGVLGLRPSPGVVLDRGESRTDPGFGVSGPIARTAADLRALLQTMAEPGVDLGSRTSLPSAPPRVGWLDALCEALPFEDGVLDTCREAAARWTDQLVSPVGAHDDALSREALWQAWLVIRHDAVGGWVSAAFSEAEISAMKPEVQWEVEGFRGLSDDERRRGYAAVGDIRRAVGAFFDEVDLLMLPTAQVWPFASELAWPTSVGGVDMDTYHRWMEVTALATLAGLPTAAVPAGRDGAGRHIGLQVVGPPGGDAQVLDWVAWAEQRELFGVTPPSRSVAAPGTAMPGA